MSRPVFQVSKGRTGWSVCLPHSCSEWDIAGDVAWGLVPHAQAVADFEAFLAAGAVALAALKRGEEYDPIDVLEDDEEDEPLVRSRAVVVEVERGRWSWECDCGTSTKATFTSPGSARDAADDQHRACNREAQDV